MGRLTTHVLDTAQGCPAANVEVSLYRIHSQRELLSQNHTNSDGRLETPLLQNEKFVRGQYELIFEAGDYFRRSELVLPELLFVDAVVIRFGIDDASQHYHVPLLVSPWSYSTYRGS